MDSGSDNSSVMTLKTALDAVSGACAAYVRHMTNAPPIGNTKLDRERQKMCIYEIVSIVNFFRIPTFTRSPITRGNCNCLGQLQL